MHAISPFTQQGGFVSLQVPLTIQTLRHCGSYLMSKRKASDLDPFKDFAYTGDSTGQGLGKPAPCSIPNRGGGLDEKYRSPGRVEGPLRLLLVGHNPSAHAWSSGHYYSNPSNRMWPLLTSSGIVPPHFTSVNDDDCPWACGVGFTDLGTGNPGTKSSGFSAAVLQSWRDSFYERIKGHAQRAGAPPRIIAFTGKRQFQELLFDYPQPKGARANVEYGVQVLRPVGWPFGYEDVIVFVLTSSSGAAALRNEVREAPYKELSRLLQGLDSPPVQHLDACSSSISESPEQTETDKQGET